MFFYFDIFLSQANEGIVKPEENNNMVRKLRERISKKM